MAMTMPTNATMSESLQGDNSQGDESWATLSKALVNEIASLNRAAEGVDVSHDWVEVMFCSRPPYC
jgi:hypothetical protein